MLFRSLDARGNLVSNGGRTLTIVGLGADCDSARSAAYKAVDLVQLRGRRVRRDIGIGIGIGIGIDIGA